MPTPSRGHCPCPPSRSPLVVLMAAAAWPLAGASLPAQPAAPALSAATAAQVKVA